MLLSSFVSGEFEPSWHNFHIIEENVKHAGISHIVLLGWSICVGAMGGVFSACWCRPEGRVQRMPVKLGAKLVLEMLT